MINKAVVLICDKNFLIPSFATALSARRNLKREDVLVRILVTDADQPWCDHLGDVTQAQGISVLPAHIPEIGELKKFHRDRYLPIAALSRFWLDRFLEPSIERFLYLDGDILVDGPLEPLLNAEIPEQGFLAAADTVCLCLDELGRGPKQEKTYLEALGVKGDAYFNTGVILASRSGWRDLSAKAVNFLIENASLCRSSDQSALNAVARERRGRLSLRWNYQSDHMTIFDPRADGSRPAIWHFTGAPKPWHDPGWPWDESFNWAYREAEKLLEGKNIADPKPTMAQLEAGRAHRRRARMRLNWVYPWRRWSRSAKIRRQLDG
jgi:lipopolysaccharide biosynthesis glycosyltransferase